MNNTNHTFFIPVMGTGHSLDTPIRVAPFGISSVISLVDDLILEPVRKHYAEKYSLPYIEIPRDEPDGRAKRITAYLNTIQEIVNKKIAIIKEQPFLKDNDKTKYFELLPEDNSLKKEYKKLLSTKCSQEKDSLAKHLTEKIQPGSIDVNIMVKLDRVNYDKQGNPLDDSFTDAKAALRGFAKSSVDSCMVFSAGINQSLFSYMTNFKDFYRNQTGTIKKKIVLKVSDFRSALIQGKFLAKKGLEIHEFRVESGLNCGGHAFASNGKLLPSLLKEFTEKRAQLAQEFTPMIKKHYQKLGWDYPESAATHQPIITVQGGIGTHGEVNRLKEDFGIDATGWATPFLLVPEATSIDLRTRELLKNSKAKDVYLSDVSPLQVPINNIHNTGSEIWTQNKAKTDNPGAPCYNKFLISDTEFTEKPICLASTTYQKLKLKQIDSQEISDSKKESLKNAILEKTCICTHLGNSILIELGIVKEKNAPQFICPGPNIIWFNRFYSLKEMIDHIYGKIKSLVPPHRPHMFAKEITMYVDLLEKIVRNCTYTKKEIATIEEYKENLDEGILFCQNISNKKAYKDENLDSLSLCITEQNMRLKSIYADFQNKTNSFGTQTR